MQAPKSRAKTYLRSKGIFPLYLGKFLKTAIETTRRSAGAERNS
jgi:hypothetical protein